MTPQFITMSSRELSRHEIITQLMCGKINGAKAAKQMGVSIRHARRLKTKVKRYGAGCLIHGNRGKPSNRKLPEKNIKDIKTIMKDKYSDFGPTLAKEKLEENHSLKIGKETLRQLMIRWGLWQSRPRRTNKEYRSWRPRKEYHGEMEQFDGSYHDWFEGRADPCCLLGSIDDATNEGGCLN